MGTNSAIFKAIRLIISHNRHLSFRDLIEYLVLLKAIKLNWESNEVNYKLKTIIDFCLEKLGKFPKKEIYL